MTDLHIPTHPFIKNKSYILQDQVCLVYPESRRMRLGIPADEVIEEILVHEFLHDILRETMSINTSISLDKISRWERKRIVFHFKKEPILKCSIRK